MTAEAKGVREKTRRERDKSERPATRPPARRGSGLPSFRLDSGAVRLLWLALLIAALRLAAAWSFSGNPLISRPVLEDADYFRKIVEIRQGTTGDALLPRGSALYSYLVCLIPGLAGGNLHGLAVAQSLLEGMTAFLLMLLARRRWGIKAGVIAGILYALDPMGGFFAARLSPVVAATLAFVACLWLWDLESGRSSSSVRLSAGLGVVGAIGFLLQPLPCLFLLGIRAWEHLSRPVESGWRTRPWLGALLPFGLIAAAAGVVVILHAPMHDGGPVLAWGGGPALDHAFDPATGGTPRALKAPSWRAEADLRTEAWEGLGREGTHYDMFRFFTGRGFQRAVSSPFGTIGVLLTKAAATLGAFPIPDSLSAAFLAARSARILSYLQVSFAVLLGLGLAGWFWYRGDPTRRLLVRGLLAVGLASLLGMCSAASRQPAIPCLAALGGGWLAVLWSRTSASRTLRSSAGLLLGGVVVSILAGYLSPTTKLRDPSEDLRLLAANPGKSGGLRQSEPLLEQAVHVNPNNLEARAYLASAYMKDGLQNAAAEQLQTAYQTDSTHTSTLSGLFNLYELRGDTENSMKVMRRLVRLHPNNPLFLNQLAQTLIRAGDMSRAQNLLTRALRIKPDYDVAVRNLEVVEAYQQRLEDSFVPASMHLAQDDPLYTVIDQITAAMDEEAWSRADSLISVAEKARPDLVQPYWFRGAYYARRGELPKAIAALETCARLAPGRPMVVQQLAGLYAQAGKKDQIPALMTASLAAAVTDSVRTKELQAIRQHFAQ